MRAIRFYGSGFEGDGCAFAQRWSLSGLLRHNAEPACGKDEQDHLDENQAVEPDVSGMLGEERHLALESGDNQRLA